MMGKPIRVAFLTTHPIQYHAAWFRALAQEPSLDFEVLYCHSPAPAEQGTGFGVAFTWDTPLLGGYRHRFLRNVAATPTLNGFNGLDTPEVATMIREHRFDAVVINGWHFKSAWQAMRACWKAGVPVLVRSDSHLRTPRHPLKELIKAVPYRWFIPRLDGCLAVGKWSADYFQHFGAPAERVFVVPHVVDGLFERESLRAKGMRHQLRAQWGLAPEQTVFVFAAKFIAKKRPFDFIHAIEQAHAASPNVVGLMVGDGSLRAECERVVHERQIPVRFTGFLNQSAMVDALVASDALVLPSDGGETWGLIVNEAMSCGRAAVVSDHVGCGPDLVQDGETGAVFPLGDVETLATRLAVLAQQPRALAAMGDRAQVRIRNYSIDNAVERLTHAVRWVARAA